MSSERILLEKKCREDWVILEVGYRKYLDKKHDQSKKDETSKT